MLVELDDRAALPSSHGAVTASPGDGLQPGTTLGHQDRYRIEHVLGKGGFGEAYLARDTQLDRPCVVKRLVLDPDWSADDQALIVGSFAREARLLVSLNTPGHPNIPEIFEYLPDKQALVMKYIQGRSLAELLNRRADGLPEEEALRYARDVCAALVYMHRRTPEPVLHRDIKPANILLDAEGRIWLIDFGLAKALPQATPLRTTQATQVAGTLGYTPHEQWQGAAEPRSDVYALTATLHVLLTNYQPTRAELLALMQGRDNVLPPVRRFNPAVRPEVEHLITQGMRTDVAARPTAQEFLVVLDDLLARVEIPPPPEPTHPPQVSDVVGRAEELAMFARRLTDEHLAIITGLAGVGKTTLASLLARQVSDANKVFWHSFHEGEGIDAIIWEMAAFMAWHGQNELWRLLNHARQRHSQLPPFEVLLDYLIQTVPDQGYLLCFDDVQFIDDDPLFNQLLKRLQDTWQTNGSAIIITSRSIPTFAQHETITVLAGLNLNDTGRLLAQRGLALNDEQLRVLYAHTEGNAQFLTLAIDALRRTKAPVRLLARLSEASNIENYLLREVDGGLSAEERAVMESVAVLLGYGGTRAVIEVLLDEGGLRQTLNNLRRRHLLEMSESDAGPIYHQHAIVQAFYYDGLSQRKRQQLHQRAADYYETDERDVLRAARHYKRAGNHERSVTLATIHRWWFINTGQARALHTLLGQFTAQQVPPAQWIELLMTRGEVATLLGERETARASYQEALMLLAAQADSPTRREQNARACRGMGELLEYEVPQEALDWLQRGLDAVIGTNTLETALIRVRVGSVLIGMGNYPAARTALEEGLRLLPPDAEDWRANALTNLGVVYCAQGDIERGTACYQEALQIYQQAQNYWKLGNVWQNLGFELELAGDWPGAETEYQKALELAERLGNVTRQTELELNLGNLRLRQGDTKRAATHLTTSLELARRYNLQESLVYIQASLADLQCREHDWQTATRALEEAEQLAITLAIKSQQPEINRTWGAVYLAQGQVQAALDRLHQSVQLARDLDDPREEGMSQRVLGQALLADGQPAAALAAFAHSHNLLDGRDPYEAARTQAMWGQALLDSGDEAQGQALLAQARTELQRMGVRMEDVGSGGLTNVQ